MRHYNGWNVEAAGALMAKTVYYMQDGITRMRSLVRRLDSERYRLVPLDRAELDGAIAGDLAAHPGESFAFILSKRGFLGEEQGREIAAAIWAGGVRAEPAFLVAGRGFSVEEIDLIIPKGHPFFLDYQGNGDDAVFLRFKVALDKVLMDFERNSSLIDYIAEDLEGFVERERLRTSNSEIERLNSELEQRNRIDELTRLLNRKGIMDSTRAARGRAGRERARLAGVKTAEEHFGHMACMMIDIDDFKKVNDTYGHLVGDRVLHALGDLLQTGGVLRGEDVAGRYGGEEFLVVLPATTARHAVVPAEKLRRAVEAMEIAGPDADPLRITVSIGIAELENAEASIESIIGNADTALYAAKARGKNRVVRYDRRLTPLAAEGEVLEELGEADQPVS